MTQIVHVQTTIQTIFGVLDDDGNVIAQPPVAVTVSRFNPEAFVEAHAAIAQARGQAIANMSDPPTPSETSGGSPASG